MPFYQNPFDDEFRGNWILDDHQLSLVFKCVPNKNRSDLALGWNYEPYDLSTYNTLKIWYAFDKDFKNWAALPINIAGATPSATLAAEVIAALNANPTFTDYFSAGLDSNVRGTNKPAGRPLLKSVKPKHALKFYLDNGGAERKIKFNKYAGLADLPSYFDRHTIANRFNYTDSVNMLVRLSKSITNISIAVSAVVTSSAHGLTTGDTIYIANSNSTPVIDGAQVVTVLTTDTFSVPITTTVAGTRGEWLDTVGFNVVTDFGLNPLVMKNEWQQLSGGSNTFLFTNQTLDGSGRVTQKIQYHAGSVAGDLSVKTIYTYSGASTNPVQTFQVPYQLQSGDLITPP